MKAGSTSRRLCVNVAGGGVRRPRHHRIALQLRQQPPAVQPVHRNDAAWRSESTNVENVTTWQQVRAREETRTDASCSVGGVLNRLFSGSSSAPVDPVYTTAVSRSVRLWTLYSAPTFTAHSYWVAPSRKRISPRLPRASSSRFRRCVVTPLDRVQLELPVALNDAVPEHQRGDSLVQVVESVHDRLQLLPAGLESAHDREHSL